MPLAVPCLANRYVSRLRKSSLRAKEGVEAENNQHVSITNLGEKTQHTYSIAKPAGSATIGQRERERTSSW